jgi:poly(beta-D-mannuronate) lyase
MSSGSTTQPEPVDFEDVSARYVRIVGHGNTLHRWNSITEVDVYGQ